ncbi:uncharacterized protein LOC131932862 [Physella acuta]|uniref:uncharacterized protein LOC131932862 n=1 Tax=Physella acuta TaxID=109671 RepID=UPI0027DBFC47|nr:uncharacterized protein LOC131932862 [Physella acuta]
MSSVAECGECLNLTDCRMTDGFCLSACQLGFYGTQCEKKDRPGVSTTSVIYTLATLYYFVVAAVIVYAAYWHIYKQREGASVVEEEAAQQIHRKSNHMDEDYFESRESSVDEGHPHIRKSKRKDRHHRGHKRRSKQRHHRDNDGSDEEDYAGSDVDHPPKAPRLDFTVTLTNRPTNVVRTTNKTRPLEIKDVIENERQLVSVEPSPKHLKRKLSDKSKGKMTKGKYFDHYAAKMKTKKWKQNALFWKKKAQSLESLHKESDTKIQVSTEDAASQDAGRAASRQKGQASVASSRRTSIKSVKTSSVVGSVASSRHASHSLVSGAESSASGMSTRTTEIQKPDNNFKQTSRNAKAGGKPTLKELARGANPDKTSKQNQQRDPKSDNTFKQYQQSRDPKLETRPTPNEPSRSTKPSSASKLTEPPIHEETSSVRSVASSRHSRAPSHISAAKSQNSTSQVSNKTVESATKWSDVRSAHASYSRDYFSPDVSVYSVRTDREKSERKKSKDSS